jgi:hypothetical protein
VILAAATTNYRLPLGGTAVAIQAPSPATAPPAAAPGTQLVVPAPPGNAVAAPPITGAPK